MHIIPVDGSVEPELKMSPYEDVRELIKRQQKIAVLDCVSQRQQQLIGRPCEKPAEVCFSFGAHSQFYRDIGNAREISLKQTLEILENPQDTGMVIQPYSAQNPAGLCNCPGDYCVALRALRKFSRPAEISSNGRQQLNLFLKNSRGYVKLFILQNTS